MQAVAFVFQSDMFALHCRICRSSDRFYILSVQGRRLNDDDVDRFFQSFRLLKK